MSQANVGIFAEVRLKVDQLRADAKRAEQELKNALGNIKLAPLKLDVSIDDKNLQQRLNAALAKITVSPINVPVNFVPGNMPGGRGAGPGGGGGGAGAARGGGYGNYFNPFGARGVSRLIGGGVYGYAADTADRLFDENRQFQVGMAHAGSNFDAQTRLMLSTRDRMMGGPIGSPGWVFRNFLNFSDPHGYEAENIINSLDETRDANRMSDVRTQSSMATIRAQEQADIASSRGVSRQRMSADARRRSAINSSRDTSENESVTANEVYGRRRSDLERELEQNDHLLPYDTPAEARIKAAIQALDAEHARVLSGIGRRAQERNAAADKEHAALLKDIAEAEGARVRGVNSSIATSNASADAAGYAAAGNPLIARGVHNRAALAALASEYEARKAGKSPQERQDIERQKQAALAALQAQQGVGEYQQGMGQQLGRFAIGNEAAVIDARLGGSTDQAERIALQGQQTVRYNQLLQSDRGAAGRYAQAVVPRQLAELEDRQRRERERANSESEDRIRDARARADEAMMRASGDSYNADRAAFFRAQDDKVRKLKEAAAAEIDVIKRTRIEREIAANVVAGLEQKAAYLRNEQRQAAQMIRAGTASARSADLYASGQVTAAGREASASRLMEELLRASESGNPAAVREAMDNIHAFNTRNARDTQLRDRGRNIETRDAEERANGQQGVGEVLGMAAQMQDELRDVQGDAGRTRDVRRLGQARFRAYLREHRRTSRTFAVEDYHDAIQQSISDGVRNDDALRLAEAAASGQDIINPRHGVGDKSRFEQPVAAPGTDIGGAAANLNAAADKIKRARELAVIR